MKKVAIIMLLMIFLFGCIDTETSNSRLKTENSKQTNEVFDMKITSSAFNHGEAIPDKYTCKGTNVNPSLAIADVPANAKSLALIVDDPDAPGGTFIHWVLYGIDTKTKEIPEKADSVGITGLNDFGRTGYGGPCPPPGPSHTYRFKLYAVDFDNWPLFETAPTASAIEKFIEGHVIAQAELDGEYQR